MVFNIFINVSGAMFIDPDDNCLLCSCNRSADGQYPGDVTCERINCTGRPDPPCDTNMLSNQTCCPECMCRYQGKFYHPGKYASMHGKRYLINRNMYLCMFLGIYVCYYHAVKLTSRCENRQ